VTTTPPEAPPAPWIADRLIELSACVCQMLTTEGTGRPCWCGLTLGVNAAWDGCGECADGGCGMGWVRLDGAYPFTAFPVEETEIASTCGTFTGYTIEVGALRCMPQNEDGQPLGPDVTLGLAVDQARDMLALRSAILCCPAWPDWPVLLGSWQPLGPEGGCVGGFWTFALGEG
jgi:hypothetical protein